MFDRLIDILVTVWRHLIPFVVIEPFEQAVLVRLGVYKRTLDPGFHWLLPFGIDVAYNEHVTPRTERLPSLGTTTSDGRALSYDVVVTYKISDIEKALLQVTDLKDAIADTCAGVIGTVLHGATWESVVSGDALKEVELACRKRGWRWGVEIMAVQLCGVALVRNLRLIHSGAQAPHQLHIGIPPN
jgi:regulator of protease activity HflC (stomatin/prohibitin superfamily)